MSFPADEIKGLTISQLEAIGVCLGVDLLLLIDVLYTAALDELHYAVDLRKLAEQVRCRAVEQARTEAQELEARQ